MRKLIFAAAAAAVLLMSTAGCSENSGNAGEGTTSASTSSAGTGTEGNVGASETSAETAPETDGEETSDGTSDNTVQKLGEIIKSAYGENYLPNTDIPPEMIKSLVGLEDDSYTEILAEQPMIGAHPDVLIIVRAANGKTGEIKGKLEAYRSRLVNDSVQYPMNIAKVNASQVVANGDYVAFILLGAINDELDSSEEEQARFAEEQVMIGVEAFNGYFS